MEFLDVADPFWILGLGDMRRQKMFEAVFNYCGSYPHLTNTMVLPQSRLYTYKCED